MEEKWVYALQGQMKFGTEVCEGKIFPCWMTIFDQQLHPPCHFNSLPQGCRESDGHHQGFW